MALWIGSFYAWSKRRSWGIFYVLVCVPGALAALLFPNWSRYPLWNYMHIHAFVSHGLIVAFGIWLMMGQVLEPHWKDLWIPALFGGVGCLILYPINRWLGTNYWFLNWPSAGSPLPLLWNLVGERFYPLAYYLFCMVVIVLWLALLRFLFYCGRKTHILG
jgi:uncharacterized membrane protein YwaF